MKILLISAVLHYGICFPPVYFANFFHQVRDHTQLVAVCTDAIWLVNNYNFLMRRTNGALPVPISCKNDIQTAINILERAMRNLVEENNHGLNNRRHWGFSELIHRMENVLSALKELRHLVAGPTLNQLMNNHHQGQWNENPWFIHNSPFQFKPSQHQLSNHVGQNPMLNGVHFPTQIPESFQQNNNHQGTFGVGPPFTTRPSNENNFNGFQFPDSNVQNTNPLMPSTTVRPRITSFSGSMFPNQNTKLDPSQNNLENKDKFSPITFPVKSTKRTTRNFGSFSNQNPSMGFPSDMRTKRPETQNGNFGASSCKPILSEQSIMDIVQLHNKYRNMFNRGPVKAKNGIFPKSLAESPIPELIWDQRLASFAQRHTDSCQPGHSSVDLQASSIGFSSIGENVFSITTLPCDCKTSIKWTEAVESWFNEINNYPKSQICKEMASFSRIEFPAPPGQDGQVGHFTQVIGSSSTRLGCGISRCGCTIRITCNYGEAGNFLGLPVYNFGNICQN